MPILNPGEEQLDAIARERADWLVDAVATATQNRALLRGEDVEDTVLTEAILQNGHKAILVALLKVKDAR